MKPVYHHLSIHVISQTKHLKLQTKTIKIKINLRIKFYYNKKMHSILIKSNYKQDLL